MIFDDYTFVTGVFDISQNIDYYNEKPEIKPDLELDGEDIELISVTTKSANQVLTDGVYQIENNKMILKVCNIPDDHFQVQIGCKLYPQNNTKLSGLYTSNNMFCTQCESQGFRRIIYSLDRPDVMSTYTVRITANKTKNPILLLWQFDKIWHLFRC